jgi:hypothetical protein
VEDERYGDEVADAEASGLTPGLRILSGESFFASDADSSFITGQALAERGGPTS